MKARSANVINSAVLILVSGWGYFAAAAPSITSLIPAAFGALFLFCHPGLKAENKLVAHIAALLTLLVFVALFMPFQPALERGDNAATVQVAVMLASSLVAIAFFCEEFRRCQENGKLT